jgi:hypothetical protein
LISVEDGKHQRRFFLFLPFYFLLLPWFTRRETISTTRNSSTPVNVMRRLPAQAVIIGMIIRRGPASPATKIAPAVI